MVEKLEIDFGRPGFIPVFNSWPQKIKISNSSWFTLEHVLGCTCTAIELSYSPLGNKALDVILRKWMTGGFPKLERLEIYSDDIKDSGPMILGMNLIELNRKIIPCDDGSKWATINCDNYQFVIESKSL